MVSWSRAFGAAGMYVVFLIIWGVISGIFIFAGIMTAGTLIAYDPLTGLPRFNLAGAGIGLVLFLIGYVIILLGSMATLFKILSEVVAEEVQRRISFTARK
ncbi:MAG: hypothetical protein DRO05_06175 [Thermoproteota archaeon]|nr:MAG: hypothetical protein DRO05_06175 [Candidatus Korarchaeota archaeon]